MRGLARLGVTVATLVLAGLFIAGISANLYVGTITDPSVPGKYAVQFALGFALVFGWAFGAAIEQLWREDPEWGDLLLAVAFRLFAGVFLFFPIIGAEAGFEALGVGLGGHS